ncbi:MAG: MFS transporter [Candidatus Acidiferrales bacterium]
MAAETSGRWRIAIVITAAIAISYFDRQTLSIALPSIARDIRISNQQFSELQAAFLFAYALMYAGGGRLLDLLGTRRGFALMMAWWSLACAAQGLATNVSTLLTGRFLLGAGEGGGFPAATKAVAEKFAPEERATAMGLINAGTAVGAIAAPPLIALVFLRAGWRGAFAISGALGLLWTAWWLREYRAGASPASSAASAAEATAPEEPSAPPSAPPSTPWIRLLGIKQVQGLVAAKFMSDAAWYFYLFWLPKYLYDVRGFNTARVGYWAWIPYAASGIGSLGGGMLSSALLKRGHTLNLARKVALGVSAALMPIILLVSRAPVGAAILIFSVAFCGQQSWSGLIMTIPADSFPRDVVGSVAGLIGFGGAIGGVIFNLVVGRLLGAGFGYPFIFAIVSTFHVVAFGIVLLTNHRIRPLDLANLSRAS